MERTSYSSETLNLEKLTVSGDVGQLKVTVAANSGALVRGAVLGKITAGGEYKLSASAAVDGSQTPDVILQMDIANSVTAQEAMVYTAGVVNESGLVLGAGHTIASIREGLRVKGFIINKDMSL